MGKWITHFSADFLSHSFADDDERKTTETDGYWAEYEWWWKERVGPRTTVARNWSEYEYEAIGEESGGLLVQLLAGPKHQSSQLSSAVLNWLTLERTNEREYYIYVLYTISICAFHYIYNRNETDFNCHHKITQHVFVIIIIAFFHNFSCYWSFHFYLFY